VELNGVDLDSQNLLQTQLASDERLLWSGRPKLGLVLRPADAFVIPFSLLWGGFAIFWEYTVLSMGKAPFFFALWGLPFVVMGLYIILGRFFVDARQRANTAYGVTNRRIIIVSGLSGLKVKSLNLRTLSDVSLEERSDAPGTIAFGPSSPNARWASGMAWPGATPTPSFEFIQNARSVYDVIRQAQASCG
jgi:hypothetical protein